MRQKQGEYGYRSYHAYPASNPAQDLLPLQQVLLAGPARCSGNSIAVA
jgi:hypothetical protein